MPEVVEDDAAAATSLVSFVAETAPAAEERLPVAATDVASTNEERDFCCMSGEE